MGIRNGRFVVPLKVVPAKRRSKMADEAEEKLPGWRKTSVTGLSTPAIPNRARKSRPPAARVIKQKLCFENNFFQGKIEEE